MRIGVKYMAQLRQATGVAVESIEVGPPCTIEKIVLELARRHGEPFRRIVLDGRGSLQACILTFVADEQVGPDAELRDGDMVTILTPMAGG